MSCWWKMRRPTSEDAGLWRRAMRDVAPLPGRPQLDRGHPDCNAAGPAAVRPAAPAEAPVPPLPPLDRFAGVDRATVERLRRGRRPVEASLDLHGMTQAEAHRALSAFIAGSRAAGRRCVLVITG